MTSEVFERGNSMNLPCVFDIMIVEFMQKSADFNQPESRNVKTQKSGRAGYGDEAIGYVGVNRCNGICRIKADIAPEHNISKSR